MLIHGVRSCSHVQFSNNADLTIRQDCGLLDRDVHLKSMLLAQDKYLMNGLALNPGGWKA